MARGVAILAMLVENVRVVLHASGGIDGLARPTTIDLLYGWSAVLFALVAGVGITLGSRGAASREDAARLLWRAAWMVPAGVLLGAVQFPGAVILAYFGSWFALAVPLLLLSTRTLWVVAAAGLVLGPAAHVHATVALPALTGADGVSGVVLDLLLTGAYPAASMLWVVATGMALGRCDLRAPRTRRTMVAGGSVVATVAALTATWLGGAVDLGEHALLLSLRGHTDSPAVTVVATGIAVAIVGACLVSSDAARRLTAPVADLGRVALTVYVGHILALTAVAPGQRSVGELTTMTVAYLVVALVGSTVWLRLLPHGPLEALDRAGARRLLDAVARQRTDA